MATQPGWETATDEAQAWNFCWLGPHFLPGIVKVRSRKARDIDKHKVKGDDGNYLEDEGYAGGQVTIELTLTTEEQWLEYQRILPFIDPEQLGGQKSPLSIVHPEPNAKGIHTVYVTSIDGDPPDSKDGKTEVIECEQFFPIVKKKKTTKTPKDKAEDAHAIVIPADINVNTFG